MTSRNRLAYESLPAIDCDWSEETHVIADHAFQLFLPTDADRLLESEMSKEASGTSFDDVYWAKLWPISLKLASFFLRHPDAIRGDESADAKAKPLILETGCGCGLTGIALATLGYRVVLSDYMLHAVQLAVSNALANQLRARTASTLQWQEDDHVLGTQLDWFSHPTDRFDTIVGADVTHDPNKHGALLLFLERSLSGPESTVWLADPGRPRWENFIAMAVDRKWDVQLFNEHGTPSGKVTAGECSILKMQLPTCSRESVKT